MEHFQRMKQHRNHGSQIRGSGGSHLYSYTQTTSHISIKLDQCDVNGVVFDELIPDNFISEDSKPFKTTSLDLKYYEERILRSLKKKSKRKKYEEFSKIIESFCLYKRQYISLYSNNKTQLIITYLHYDLPADVLSKDTEWINLLDGGYRFWRVYIKVRKCPKIRIVL